ncbi:MAG: Rpn family recombination-promoting nuclease/putative transposase [Lewinellaceae bacterium]|nr:Rpn family recombination-promoting nuclease/putative transposase [Saprospiraceae bacterium]MCB9340490.1 Rpn family recombination-promoting nuclease/putative transposase [Lewinellaceae bacterium]
MGKRKKTSTDTDHPWKQIFTYFFREAIAFIEPDLHDLIDWDRQIEFLEQELHEIIKTRFRGSKLCDKLAKVRLKDGKDLYLLVHIEIESNPKANFPKRFFWYRILIFDKHKSEDIFSIAVYTGSPSANQVDRYQYGFLTNRLLFEFPAYKIWEQDEALLLQSENIFALFVLAQQYANRTRDDMEKRFAFRKKLFEFAQAKKIDRIKILEALIFVRYLTLMPKDLEINYNQFILEKMQTEKSFAINMDHVKEWDNMLEALTGESLQKMLKEAKNEAKEVQRKLHETIRKCYHERNWSIQEIAAFFSMPESKIEMILTEK